MATLMYVGLFFISLFAVLFVLLRRLLSPTTVTACDPNWISEFSVARYRPMLRLLDEGDFKYLESHGSCSGKTVRKLRQERRRIFRSYLASLIADFNRLHMAARLLTLYSEVDCPELAAALLRQRLTFSFAVVAIQFRLALHATGAANVNVSGLLDTLGAMQGQLSTITAAAPAAS